MQAGRLRSQPVAVLAATVVAAALRLPFLGHQSLWLDETNTAAIVAHASIGGVLHSVYRIELTPPLYFVLTWIWTQVFGTSAAMLRATAGLAGVVSVPLAFLALRRLIGARAATGAAWLVATSPVLVYYSLDARAYALLVLASIASLWATTALIERPSRGRFIVWTLSVLALVYTHYFGAFVALAEAVFLALRLPATSRRALLLACVAGVVASVPLVPLFLHQNGGGQTAFIANQALGGRIEATVRQFAMGPNVPSTALEACGLALALAGLAGGVLLVRSERRRDALILLGSLLAIGLVLPVLLSATRIADDFWVRNVLGVWIALAALAALGLVRARAVPLALYVALCAATVLWIDADWRYENVDWRGAIARIGPVAPGTPIAVYGSGASPVIALYLHRHAVAGPVLARSLWVLVGSARLGTRGLDPVIGTPPAGFPPAPFTLTREVTFHGIRALRFTAPRSVSISPASLGLDSGDHTAGVLLAN